MPAKFKIGDKVKIPIEGIHLDHQPPSKDGFVFATLTQEAPNGLKKYWNARLMSGGVMMFHVDEIFRTTQEFVTRTAPVKQGESRAVLFQRAQMESLP